MSHYDLTILLLLALAVGVPCLLIGWTLSVLSWGKADELVQEATDELPRVDNWEEIPLIKNCPDCQKEKQVL